MKIPKKNTSKFSWGKVWGLNYKYPDYNRSILFAELDEPHGEVSTKEFERLYYVLGGNGVFTIAGKLENVQKGDTILIPPKTTFDYTPVDGKLTVLVFMEYWDSTKWEHLTRGSFKSL